MAIYNGWPADNLRAHQMCKEWKQNREALSPDRPDKSFEDESNQEFPVAFKEAVSAFIRTEKRLPNKDEFISIRKEHNLLLKDFEWSIDPDLINDYIQGKHDELYTQQWDNQWMTEVIEIPNCWELVNATSTITSDVPTIIDWGTVTEVSSPVCESALYSTKGVNKYTLDHPGI